MSLPRYSDCEYSLFVSYAYADNHPYNDWVSDLKDALWARLDSLHQDIKRHPIHLSEKGGPAAGILEPELRDRLQKSFAMLIVVGPRYVTSGWCEKELQLFSDIFKSGGFAERLFIVAMTKEAYEKVVSIPTWERLVPKDQIWRPFYRDDGTLITPRRDNMSFTASFFTRASELAEPLLKRIGRDFAERQDDREAPERPAGGVQFSSSGKRMSVMIGAVTDDLEAAADELDKLLLDAGHFETFRVNPKRVAQWRQVGQLGEDLRQADAFVVPFSAAMPLNPLAFDGGHLAIQQNEWLALNKSREIIWYRPKRDLVPTRNEDPSLEAYLKFINTLSPVCASAEAVKAELQGRKLGGATLKLYIERNRNEREVWKRLARRLRALWDELEADRRGVGTDLSMRAHALDMDQLNKDPSFDDADGVVLLFGKKHPASLSAQILRVEDIIHTRDAVYPGFVACLIPPHGPEKENVAEHLWDYYRFETEPPPGVREIPNDTESVKGFLRDLREQKEKRLGGGV